MSLPIRRADSARPLLAAGGRGRGGYSLMEILVVLAIFALSTAVIMPSTSRMLDQTTAHAVFFEFQRQVSDLRREANRTGVVRCSNCGAFTRPDVEAEFHRRKSAAEGWSPARFDLPEYTESKESRHIRDVEDELIRDANRRAAAGGADQTVNASDEDFEFELAGDIRLSEAAALRSTRSISTRPWARFASRVASNSVNLRCSPPTHRAASFCVGRISISTISRRHPLNPYRFDPARLPADRRPSISTCAILNRSRGRVFAWTQRRPSSLTRTCRARTF